MALDRLRASLAKSPPLWIDNDDFPDLKLDKDCIGTTDETLRLVVIVVVPAVAFALVSVSFSFSWFKWVSEAQ